MPGSQPAFSRPCTDLASHATMPWPGRRPRGCHLLIPVSPCPEPLAGTHPQQLTRKPDAKGCHHPLSLRSSCHLPGVHGHLLKTGGLPCWKPETLAPASQLPQRVHSGLWLQSCLAQSQPQPRAPRVTGMLEGVRLAGHSETEAQRPTGAVRVIPALPTAELKNKVITVDTDWAPPHAWHVPAASNTRRARGLCQRPCCLLIA